jgi:uncharacterized protein involved in exopolysaccharide biosynthesis
MSHATIRPHDVLDAVKQNPWRVALPVILVTLLALGYALVRPTRWEATQALVVRDAAGDRLARPGRFALVDEMKSSQETILELAKSRTALVNALKQVGPPANATNPEAWPTEDDLEALQDSIKIVPPKGAEFGKTEMFYLKVTDKNRERALQLAEVLSHTLQERYGELRETKARSTIEELTKAASLAKHDLNTATDALGKLEQSVGSDLAELRILNDLPSGDSDLRRTATELDKELRAYRATQSENEESLKLLREAEKDPTSLLASPGVLLKSQTALGRLRDGLVDAQLRTGQALGTMSEEHPLTKGARAAEQAIRDQVHDEISVAIRGVEADMRVNVDRMKSLEAQSAEIQARLERLGAVRADYANLAATAKNRLESLKTVEHDLAEARASHAAARSASLISLVGQPETGNRPVGPGRASLVAAGFGGGLLLALGILFLTVTPRKRACEDAGGTLPLATPRAASSTSALTLKQALQRVSSSRI